MVGDGENVGVLTSKHQSGSCALCMSVNILHGPPTALTGRGSLTQHPHRMACHQLQVVIIPNVILLVPPSVDALMGVASTIQVGIMAGFTGCDLQHEQSRGPGADVTVW